MRLTGLASRSGVTGVAGVVCLRAQKPPYGEAYVHLMETVTTEKKPSPVTTIWYDSFEITSDKGTLPLSQIDRKWFALGDVDIVFPEHLDTGLERFIGRPGSLITEAMIADIRHLDSTKLPRTDLASVPSPMRWFTNTYGRHTPAALIHDRLIPGEGEEPIIEEEHADRYYRFMLKAVGVPFFKRSIMWTAVAMRTRWKSRKPWRPVLLVAWLLVAVFGITCGVASITNAIWNTGIPFGLSPSTAVLIAAAVAPAIATACWGKQWYAAVVAAVAAPIMIPAAALASIAYATYRSLEWVLAVVANVRDKLAEFSATIWMPTAH